MDTNNKPLQFDFDAWADLARKDPQAFEVKRKLLLERAIMKAAPERRQRLRCLQWKLDRIRDLASTPLSACLQINQLLWENICSDHGLLRSLERLTDLGGTARVPRQRAKVLKFQPGAPASLLPPDE
jgi:hypothetical protein